MDQKIFSDCRLFIIPNGLLKKRIELFEKQILKYGGNIISDINDSSITHIIIEDNYLLNPYRVKNALNSVKLLREDTNYVIVGTLWLSKCLKEKKLLSTEEFLFNKKRKLTNELCEKFDEPQVKIKIIKVHKIENENIKDTHNKSEENKSNQIIINELQKLADGYRARNDKWRNFAYIKAIASLKSYPKCINNINELKSLPNITPKIIDKISEIMEDGYLSKVQDIYDEKTKTLEMFSKIWGAGPVTVQLWYQKGLRTLDDLNEKGNLTFQQKIGLKYYNEIQELIPRSEVKEIIDMVSKTALEVKPSLRIMPCGSYRRGKQTCGDIDILLIAKDSNNYDSILPKIIHKLKLDGFLIEDLVGTANSSSCFKYFGLCKLNRENSKVRRLDIFIVSEETSACSILHYTGSALFNRAMRLHASKMNMHLSDTTLMLLPQNKVLSTPTEEAIFEYLGLKFRPAEDREIL
ncbi:hypothetical protein PGB90_000247 [Kerria lacca]